MYGPGKKLAYNGNDHKTIAITMKTNFRSGNSELGTSYAFSHMRSFVRSFAMNEKNIRHHHKNHRHTLIL